MLDLLHKVGELDLQLLNLLAIDSGVGIRETYLQRKSIRYDSNKNLQYYLIEAVVRFSKENRVSCYLLCCPFSNSAIT